ncbi:MAG: hypothetical protein ACREA2_17815 [Blastocatellia bacterium]
MSNNYEDIVGAALTLPPATKAMLAEHLLASLDTLDQKEPERVDASGATITLTLDSEFEQRLLREASQHGLSPEQYAVQALEERILQTERERREKAIALVQSWIDEGDEQEQRETWEYLVRVLDEDRTSARKLFPEELKGVSW